MNQKKWFGFLKTSIDTPTMSDAFIPCTKFLKPLMNSKNVLDVGCGFGTSIAFLNSNGINATGITINFSDIKEMRKRNGFIVPLGDMHELPFKNSSFDAVYCKDTFEHSIAPLIVLNEFHRVLKENGIALIILPLWEKRDSLYHHMLLTPRQMKDLFKQTKFKLLDFKRKLFWDIYLIKKSNQIIENQNPPFYFSNYFWKIMRWNPIKKTIIALIDLKNSIAKK